MNNLECFQPIGENYYKNPNQYMSFTYILKHATHPFIFILVQSLT